MSSDVQSNGRSAPAGSDPRQQPAPAKPKAEAGKMQQLLALARERLREQQTEIAARDARIAELEQTVQEARLAAASSAAEDEPSPSTLPSRALCQVSEKSFGLLDKGRWVLFEFEDRDAVEWLRFDTLARLEDYVRRDPGSEPLEVPEPVLTVDEATRVRVDADRAVAGIADEFRKYRVQAEIERKQREALHREATAMREILVAEVDTPPPMSNIPAVASIENDLKRQIADLQRENEQLREVEAEATLASQWRKRYERAVQDSDKLQAEISALRTAGADSSEYAALARDHDQLRKEFKVYRHEALKALRAQEQESNAKAGTVGPRAIEALGDRNARRRAADESLAKLQYLKNLLLNYLASAEPKAREHMERAIATVLAFNKDELAHISAAKAANAPGFFS